jgi:hypothetical protein
MSSKATIDYSYHPEIPQWLALGILKLAYDCVPFKFRRSARVGFKYRVTQPHGHAQALIAKGASKRCSRDIEQTLHPPRTNKGEFRSYRHACRWWLAWRIKALVHEMTHIHDAQEGKPFNRRDRIPHDKRIQEIRAEDGAMTAFAYCMTHPVQRQRFNALAERVSRMKDPHWSKTGATKK